MLSSRVRWWALRSWLAVEVLTSAVVHAQNLVPNPHFEQFNSLTCDWYTAPGQLAADMVGWQAPTDGTSDIFSMLVSPICWNHPFSQYTSFIYPNPVGAEAPHSGDNMAGMWIATNGCGGIPSYREYLQIELAQPLVPGTTYCAELWWSLADNSGQATNGLGILLTDAPVNDPVCTPLGTYTPQVVSTTVLSDTTGWTLLQGSFTATTAAQWLVIGSFWSDGVTTYQPNSPLPDYAVGGYYWVDDVSLTACSTSPVLTGDTLLCEGETTTLTVLNDTIHAWADAAAPGTLLGNGPILTVSPAQTTTYLHYGSDTLFITVMVQPAPQVDLGPDLFLCAGQSVTLDASWPGATYLWNDGSSSSTIVASAAGIYAVTATLGACTALDTVQVTVGNLVVDLGPDVQLCVGDTVMLNATTPGATYLWNTGATTPTLPIADPGTYVVVVSAGTCIATDTITVTGLSAPQVDLGPDLYLCAGQSVTLAAVWSNGTLVWNDGSTGATLTVGQTGIYWASAQAGTCVAGDTVLVLPGLPPVVDLGPDTAVCAGVPLMLGPAPQGTNILWSTGATGPVTFATAPAVVWLYVEHDGCTGTDTVRVDLLDIPALDMGSDTVVCEDALLWLDAGGPWAAVQWTDGVTESLRHAPQPGTYMVMVTHACGTSVDSVAVTWTDCTNELHVPNAFTPNGDGINDAFGPVSTFPLVDAELWIFDRWGQVIHRTFEASPIWEGRFPNGEPAPIGVYTWRLEYGTPREALIGHVTLIR